MAGGSQADSPAKTAPSAAIPRTGIRLSFGSLLSGRANGLIALAIFAVGTVIAWLRLPAAAQGTLWAEDARIFLGQAVRLGSFPAIFRSYSGYLHTIPRIIAGLAVQFLPVDGWSIAMAGGACAIAAAVAALVFICSRDVLPWLPARVMLACVTILIPLAPREVLGNTANLHWYVLWLTPWLLLYRPRSRAGSWLLGAVTLFAALTEIQMILFVPLLLWQWRERRRWPVRAMYLLGMATQVIVTVLLPRAPSTGTPIGAASLGYGYLINSALSVWSANPHTMGRLLTAWGPVSGVVALAPFPIAAAYGIRRGTRLQRLMIVTLLAASLVLYAVAVEISPGTFYDYAKMSQRQLSAPWLARYGVVPSMCLVAIVIIASAVAIANRRLRSPDTNGLAVRRLAPWIALVAMLAILLVQFTPASTRRSGGPLWEPQVVAQREVCESAPPRMEVVLAGAPASSWVLDVSCSRLESSSR